MDRLQGSLVQAAIKRLVKEFKGKVRVSFVLSAVFTHVYVSVSYHPCALSLWCFAFLAGRGGGDHIPGRNGDFLYCSCACLPACLPAAGIAAAFNVRVYRIRSDFLLRYVLGSMLLLAGLSHACFFVVVPPPPTPFLLFLLLCHTFPLSLFPLIYRIAVEIPPVNNRQGTDVVMMVVGMQGRRSAEETRQRREFVDRLAKTCGNFSESDVSTRWVHV